MGAAQRHRVSRQLRARPQRRWRHVAVRSDHAPRVGTSSARDPNAGRRRPDARGSLARERERRRRGVRRRYGAAVGCVARLRRAVALRRGREGQDRSRAGARHPGRYDAGRRRRHLSCGRKRRRCRERARTRCADRPLARRPASVGCSRRQRQSGRRTIQSGSRADNGSTPRLRRSTRAEAPPDVRAASPVPAVRRRA